MFVLGSILFLHSVLLCASLDPAPCRPVADVVLLLDVSGSIRDNTRHTWMSFMGFVDSLVNCLAIHPDQIRVAAVQFSTEASLEFHLGAFTSSATVKEAVDMETWPFFGDGRTNLADGLHLAASVFQRRQFVERDGEVPRIVVAVTDGNHNVKSSETDARVTELQAVAHVLAVGVTKKMDTQELHNVASSPTDLFHGVDFHNLTGVMDRLYELMCPYHGGPHALPAVSLRVDKIPPAQDWKELECSIELDIIIAMSGCEGGRPCLDSWLTQMYFVETLARTLLLGHHNVSLTLVTPGKMEFQLRNGVDAVQVTKALDSVVYDGVEGNIEEAMRHSGQVVVVEGREGVAKIVYMLLDTATIDLKLLNLTLDLASVDHVVPVGVTYTHAGDLRRLASCDDCYLEEIDMTTGPTVMAYMTNIVCPPRATPSPAGQAIQLQTTKTSPQDDISGMNLLYMVLLAFALLVALVGIVYLCLIMVCPKQAAALAYKHKKGVLVAGDFNEEKPWKMPAEKCAYINEMDVDISTITEKELVKPHSCIQGNGLVLDYSLFSTPENIN